jgi:hypothetical protein
LRARGVERAPARTAGPDLSAFQREAVRALLDLVGPLGEGLAVRMERVTTAAELRTLVQQAQQIVANTRGRGMADAYAARFSGL